MKVKGLFLSIREHCPMMLTLGGHLFRKQVEGGVCGHSHGSTRPARCCGRLSTHSLQMLQVSVMGDDKPAVCPSMTVSSDVQPGGHV